MDLNMEYSHMLNFASFGNMGSNKSAYILVYERTQKGPLSFVFDNQSLTEKEQLVAKLVKADAVADVVEVAEGDTVKVNIPYYAINPYIPKKLNKEIMDDNFKFLVEQHVYSKEFLQFFTGISSFSQISNFNPEKLPNRIFQNKIPPKFKNLLLKVLQLQFNLFYEIVCKTEDNNVIHRI
jgi:hypothetical protein